MPQSLTTQFSTITHTSVSNVTEIAPVTTTQFLTVTSTKTSTEAMMPVAISAVNRSNGLTMQLAMNTSTVFANPLSVNQSGGILIMISLYNTLPTANNLSSSQAWPIAGLLAGPCSGYKPIGIAVMKGFYSPGNISQGQPLHLFQQIYCPAYFPAQYYIFGPTSDYVRMFSKPNSPAPSNVSQNSNPLGDMEAVVSLSGSCCRQLPGPQNCSCYIYSPIPFSTGTYTVVGGDEWGDLAILHFFVLP
ncbi:MAG: hypothetical protein ACHQ1H_01705 [Nitrososphaerales archaeon]